MAVVTVAPRLTDFDRHSQLPFSKLLRFVQNSRARWYMDGDRYAALVGRGQLTVVKMQWLVLSEGFDGATLAELELRTRVGLVGTTSYGLETPVAMADGGAPVASSTVLMVNMDAETRRPVPLMDGFLSAAELARAAESEAPPYRQQCAALFDGLLEGPVLASARHRVLVRYSDEDTNRHVNHAHYAKFFEDALVTLAEDAAAPDVCRAAPRGMLIEYVVESHAGDLLVVETEVRAGGASQVLFFSGSEETGGSEETERRVVCRARVMWNRSSSL